MSDIKLEDLPPAPLTARFLEDHFAQPLTEAQMKAVRGGSGALEQGFCGTVPPGVQPEVPDWMRAWFDGFPGTSSPVPLPLYSPMAP